MLEDNSLEFDLFEDLRLRLTEVLVLAGHERLKAERVALYVVQGVRDVPKLLAVLSTRQATETEARVLEILDDVLTNAPALIRAQNILLGIDDPNPH